MVDRYDKVHRVPFGEYVPARAFFDRLADLSAVPRDAIAGRGPGVLDTGGRQARRGHLLRGVLRRPGPRAVRAGGRVLLVPTNASSYSDAQVPAQEVAVARLRAIETGRWVVQAAPTGYSAVIDHRGRVLQSAPLGSAAVLQGVVRPAHGGHAWTVVGSAPVLVAAGLGLVFGLVGEET